MPKRLRKRPLDLNSLAAQIVAEATAEKPPPKNAAAVALGRLGGAKGGVARAKALSPEQRKASAQKAALARWKANKDKE